MKIALAVIEQTNFDINKNINKMETLIKKASISNCNYIFFGEAVLNGFDGLTWKTDKDIKYNAIAINSEYIKKIKNFTNDYNIGCGFGYYEKTIIKNYKNINKKNNKEYNNKENNKINKQINNTEQLNIFDSYMILNNNGNLICNFRRLSKGWKEPVADNNVYKEGNEISVFKLEKHNKKKFSITICGDLWHDDIFEKYKKLDFDILLWPLYLDYTVDKWENEEKQEYFNRIKELKKYCILINSIQKGEQRANGGAYFIDNNGKIIASLDLLKEDIVIIDI